MQREETLYICPRQSCTKVPQSLSLTKSGPQISFRVPASKQATIKTKGRSRIGAVEVSSALVRLIGVVSDDPRQFHFRGSNPMMPRPKYLCGCRPNGIQTARRRSINSIFCGILQISCGVGAIEAGLLNTENCVVASKGAAPT